MKEKKNKRKWKSLAMQRYYIFFCKINNNNNWQKKND